MTSCRRFLPCVVLLIALAAVPMRQAGSVAQSDDAVGPYPATIRAGTCADPRGVAVLLTPLEPAVATDDTETVGLSSATNIQRSLSTVELSLADLTTDAHSLSVETDEDVIACGDIGGVVDDGALVIGLPARNGSGLTGIAELAPDGDRLMISIYLAPSAAAEPAASTPIPAARAADAAVAVATAASAPAAIAEIAIEGSAFNPPQIEIAAGTTVTWTYQEAIDHTVESEGLVFAGSEVLDLGDAFSHTFTEPGTYAYYCGPHPFMRGTIVVTEG